MDDFLFLDTETTGNDLLNDRLFQLCYKNNEIFESEYFKPPVPISIKSQSITHITNREVQEKEPFAESIMKNDVSILLKEKILVAHNAVFDIAMLVHEGVDVPRFICTLKLARALDTEAIIPEYNLQYLRYYLDLRVDAHAHDARDDVLVLEALFKRLYAKILETHPDPTAAIEEMIAISLRPSLFTMLPFGKHRGKRVEEVVIADRSYVQWLLEQKLQKPEGEEDWIFTLKYHLKVS